MIRKAKNQELDQILIIYENARRFMAENGNPGQWYGGYPSRELLESDLEKGQLYVYKKDDEIGAVFVFFVGEEPTYRVIDGQWPNEKPYGVLHRIAVAKQGYGIGSLCLQWCLQQCGNMRGDTHRNNASMQRLFAKNGFSRCGIVWMNDGSERIAYQKTLEDAG